jgi:hypothetical protein
MISLSVSFLGYIKLVEQQVLLLSIGHCAELICRDFATNKDLFSDGWNTRVSLNSAVPVNFTTVAYNRYKNCTCFFKDFEF